MSKKILKFGEGKFGWSENFNEHPLVNLIENLSTQKEGVHVFFPVMTTVRLLASVKSSEVTNK